MREILSDLPAWKQSQREPLPSRRIAPLREVHRKADLLHTRANRPIPTGGTVTLKNGDILRYFSDGSLRHYD